MPARHRHCPWWRRCSRSCRRRSRSSRSAPRRSTRQNEALAEAKKQLDLESARYRELFDLAPDGYLVTNTLGIILEANRAASELLGTPGHFLDQKPVVVFVDAADRRLVLNHLHDAVARRHGPVVEFEARFAPPNHESFPASVHLTVGGAADPADPPCAGSSATSAAASRPSERSSRARHATGSSRRAQPTSSSRPTRWAAVTFASPSIQRTFSLDPVEVEGRAIADLVHPDDRAALVVVAGGRAPRPARRGGGVPFFVRQRELRPGGGPGGSVPQPRGPRLRTAVRGCVTSGSAKRPGSRCKRR